MIIFAIVIIFVYIVKPKEFIDEELDSSDPNSMYFVYICKKTRELVLKKKIKLGKVTKKEIKNAKPQGRRANLKPSDNPEN